MTTPVTQPFFVVIEGLDGAGKSTCALKLARHLGAQYMTTPAPAIRACHQVILDSFQGCQEAAQLFYLSTVFAASRKVRAALAEGTSVVMDRYFLSTQTYAQFRGSSLDLDELERALIPADLTVYLDVPLAIRAKRLERRHASDDDRETLTARADAHLRALYMEKSVLPVAGKWLQLSIKEEAVAYVVERIAAALEESPRTLSRPGGPAEVGRAAA
jgi:thymidylate kinase